LLVSFRRSTILFFFSEGCRRFFFFFSLRRRCGSLFLSKGGRGGLLPFSLLGRGTFFPCCGGLGADYLFKWTNTPSSPFFPHNSGDFFFPSSQTNYGFQRGGKDRSLPSLLPLYSGMMRRRSFPSCLWSPPLPPNKRTIICASFPPFLFSNYQSFLCLRYEALVFFFDSKEGFLLFPFKIP